MEVPKLAVSLKPGYVSTILITPSQIVTSDEVKELPIAKRNCRFQNENNTLELFKVYTQANCNFECRLKAAYAKCHCIPWDYPRLNESMLTCDRFGRSCFKTLLGNPDIIKKCKCLPDCSSTMYGYSVDSSKIDANALCSDNKLMTVLGIYNPQMATTIQHYVPPLFIRRFEDVVYGKNISNFNLCLERVSKLTIINFQIKTNMVIQIKKIRRRANTLSNIGILHTSME